MNVAVQIESLGRRQGGRDPVGQQYRGDLRSRHPGAEGRVARRAQGRHCRAARRQRRRQDHDAEGDLQSSAFRARRRDQGLDRVRGPGGAGPLAQPARAARLRAGDGRPALLRPSHHRGESPHRRLHAQGRPRGDRGRPRADLPVFPAPEGSPPCDGRLYLGRRTADVRDRPRDDVAPEDDPARRAVDGSRAADRRGDFRDRASRSTRRKACRSCSPSRTPSWR